MKLSQGPLKFVIGCWTRPGTTLVYTREKCQSDHEVQGPKRHILRPTSSIDMVQQIFVVGEAKEVLW